MATITETLPDGDVMRYCDECESVLDDAVMCNCQEYALVRDSRSAFDVSCQTCGYAGSMERVGLHSCQIAEQGGRCEDYPCCGHTDGDGCQTLPEHTADYWTRMMERVGPERWDEMDAAGYFDRD